MEIEYIQHIEGQRRLIVVFAGWSTTPDLYADIAAENWDVILAYDFTDENLAESKGTKKLKNILASYSTVYVVAWSLGVAAAEVVMADVCEKITAAFAVNGTLRPVSDLYGIPESIYHGTEANLNPRNLLKFRKRMSSTSDLYQIPIDNQNISEADIERLKMELRQISAFPYNKNLPWKRVYISKNDRIFPCDSMSRFWKDNSPETQIVMLEAGHYIPISKIIKEITPDTERIAKRFHRALPSYDANATAQLHIVEKLIEMLPEEMQMNNLKMLEIGAGSGLLTKRLVERVSIHSATFVDLYPLERFGIFPDEKYFVGDAELLLDMEVDGSGAKQGLHQKLENDEFEGNCEVKKLGNGYDLIVSANTIQWFADIKKFFKNASGLLKPGGVLLCSTFLPGNLKELDICRPAPLMYHSRDELERYLDASFNVYQTEEEEISLQFNSARDLLYHLKATGVGGGSKTSARNLLTSLSTRPELTYKPLYIYARKK